MEKGSPVIERLTVCGSTCFTGHTKAVHLQFKQRSVTWGSWPINEKVFLSIERRNYPNDPFSTGRNRGDGWAGDEGGRVEDGEADEHASGDEE
jgi:hypothetical protein